MRLIYWWKKRKQTDGAMTLVLLASIGAPI